MKRLLICSFAVAASAFGSEDLAELGCLDVTQAPYHADPTGQADSTDAIQRAVNDARDSWRVCFFPEGTYQISDTISCEQQVARLDRPRYTDDKAQHYWDRPNRITMIGSTKGKRPLLKLAPDARGFDDPKQPKRAVWVWAQTRNSAEGSEEPEWGVEQPNISFGHIFRGIDIDVSGHAGAIGIRHSGSQGSSLQDVTINAEGAYAGLSNCCGQGGGTHNVEVIGGQFGIRIDRNSRFPLLNACAFRGQAQACVAYTMPSQMPTLLVGCLLRPANGVAVDLKTHGPHAGVSLVDCIVELPESDVVCATEGRANIFMEDVALRGASHLRTDGLPIAEPDRWRHIDYYSCSRPDGVSLINGKERTDELASWRQADSAPSFAELKQRHWQRLPSFEDEGVVSVRRFGARGDGATDDTQAFRKAIAASDDVFVPKGKYLVTGELKLRPNTRLFGLSSSLCSVGAVASKGRDWQRDTSPGAFSLVAPTGADARPGVHFLSLRGRLDWRSGGGSSVLAPAVLNVAQSGGGRFYGIMARGGQFVLKGLRRPTSFYALNVERKGTNPQSLFSDCQGLRVYYFKVEAGTLNRPNAGDANTPCRIENSRDIRVYCMQGVTRKLENRPMLDVAGSDDIRVSQLKTFSPQGFPHLIEEYAGERHVIPCERACALFLREGGRM